METAKAEVCPACNSTAHTNLVWIRTGEPITVFVKCAACGAYVARYRLSEYVSDQPYPSALRRLRCAERQSARQTLKNLQQLNFQLPAEFNHVQQIALPEPERARIDTLIVEAESDYDEEGRGETD